MNRPTCEPQPRPNEAPLRFNSARSDDGANRPTSMDPEVRRKETPWQCPLGANDV